MKGYFRSMFYWAYCMEILFLSMLGAIVLVIFIYIFITGDMDQVFQYTITYIPMFGVIYPVSSGMNMANMQVPLALSNGSTRKETACGFLVTMHAAMLQFWIVSAVCCVIIPAEHIPDDYLEMCGLLFLAGCGIGNGLGAVILRFGNKVGWIVYMFAMFILIGGAVAVSLLLGKDTVTAILNNSPIFVAGMVFDVLMSVAYYMGIKKYEVRI